VSIYQWLESDLFPDWLIRLGIRRLLDQKTQAETEPDVERQQERLMRFVEELKASPIAIEEKAANEQHYEVPSDFFLYALGPRLKYSCAQWNPGTQTLAEAEETMLSLYGERAQVEDGMTILDLGCGWGSLSLWLAEKYPNARITGLSNSRTQKAFIDSQAQARGFTNLTIRTENINTFEPQDEFLGQFDRILSIEMMEHMKNYQKLFAKIAPWLKPDGKLFVHIFTHQRFAYHYEDTDGTDWLTRYFFTGGTMPSADLFHYFQDDLLLERQWAVNGQHYEKTANAWVENMYRHRDKIMPILANTYGEHQAKKWWVYWKVFFLACAELWGYQNGNQWQVSHYRFTRR
jgi:cyclopropane-fatty-acyl-phospholipid synthase